MAENDEALRAQLASLPLATPSEQAYAALATQLLDSSNFWRAKAEQERRRADQTAQGAQQAILKLRESFQSECDNALASLRSSSNLTSSPSSVASSHSAMLQGQAGAGSAHASMSHQHPSHLSRRVSFNRDVVMVVSPEIGAESSAAAAAGSGGVSRVDEEDESASSSAQQAASAASAAAAAESKVIKERRLSRTEFNEGAILKQHLPLEDLERDVPTQQIAKSAAV